MSSIVTFYSCKGSVGRSLALAGIAVLLARRGLRVLAVDWDLEAPSLDRRFDAFELTVSRGGLLPFLVEQQARLIDDDAHLERYRDHLWTIDVGSRHALSLLPAGHTGDADPGMLGDLVWSSFFARGGGDFLERLRERWRTVFDIVLIDSPAGTSDASRICMIQMADVLVAMFGTSDLDVAGTRRVLQSIHVARQRLAYDRMALTVLPLPSRVPDGDSDARRAWLDHAAAQLGDSCRDWLPRGFEVRSVFERLAIPERSALAFAAGVAVAERASADLAGVGEAYHRSAALLATDFRDAVAALGPLRSSDELPATPVESHGSSPAGTPVVIDATSAGGHDVFVSYPRGSSDLRAWTQRFVAAVSRALAVDPGQRVEVVMDAEDRADVEFDVRRPVMQRCRVLLAITTPRYFATPWCVAEWQLFEDREQAEGRPLIVPVVLSGLAARPRQQLWRFAIDGSRAELPEADATRMQALVAETTTALREVLRASADLDERAARPPEVALPTLVTRVAEAGSTILFVPANPRGLTPLEFDVDARQIERAIARPIYQAFSVVRHRASDLDELIAALRDARPSILYFDGRGGHDGVYVDGPDGALQLVSPHAISRMFEASGGAVQLVVLNGCYDEQQAHAMCDRVDCVIGVGPAISDRAACAFADALCRALADGDSVEEAFGVGAAIVAAMERDDGPPIRLLTSAGVDAGSIILAGPRAQRSDRAEMVRKLAAADVARQQWHLDDERALVRDAYHNARRQADADPGNPTRQQSLARLLERYAELAGSRATFDDERALREELLAVRGKLAARAPGDAARQRALADALRSLAAFEWRFRDVDRARDRLGRSIAIRRALALSDPGDVEAQRDLAVALRDAGDVAQANFAFDEAQAWFAQALTVYVALAARDPDNAQRQLDLATCYERLGDSSLQGAAEDVRDWLERAIELRETLVAREPGDVELSRGLATTLEELGNIAREDASFEEAAGWFEQAAVIRKQVAAGDPENFSWQRELSETLRQLGEVAMSQERFGEAISWLEQAVVIDKAMADGHPDGEQLQRALLRTCERLTSAAGLAGRDSDAEAWLREIGLIEERLRAAGPHRQTPAILGDRDAAREDVESTTQKPSA